MKERNIRIVVSYDGSRFAGWQRQKSAPSVQEKLERSLGKILGCPVNITGCGRTDSKVHAVSYVANFRTKTRLTSTEIRNALNSEVMPEILVKEALETDLSFHSRYDATRKVYRYLLMGTKSPFLRDRASFVRPMPDMGLMKKAAAFLEGKHDFRAFQASGSSVKDTVRTVYKIRIKKEKILLDPDIKLISIEIEASGFLYKMARNIAGTLIHAGQGRIEPRMAGVILSSGDRKTAPPTARPEGLYMKKVVYGRKRKENGRD